MDTLWQLEKENTFFTFFVEWHKNILVRLSIFVSKVPMYAYHNMKQNKKTEGGTYCYTGTGTWYFPSRPRYTRHWQLYRTDAHHVYTWGFVCPDCQQSRQKGLSESKQEQRKNTHKLLKMLYAWKEQADKLYSKEISEEVYDNWRYHYPKFDTT